VYAASSDPLFPGKETTPNYQSHEFLGWWDKHFEAIADFEPYYHRLNQLQKWGCLFTVLRTKNNRSLDFLMSPAVSHNQDFQLWYGSATDIISKTELPFVDKKKFNRDTECFSLLSSHGYPLMGQIYFISGGVSLASTKDILAKMNRHNGSEIAASGSKALLKNSTKKISKASRTSGAIEASGKEGALRATVSNRRVILSWKESEFSLMKSFVNSLVAIQDGKQEGYKSDGIFKRVSGIEKAVRLGEGKSYLIKTSAMKQWIRLSINKKEKGQEYSYTASGTEPDCDIFYSKTTPAPKTIQGAVIIP
jgi:hypothetical protein